MSCASARTPHTITAMQSPGEYHHLDRMVTNILPGTYGSHVTPLAEILLGKEQLVYTRHLSPNSAFEPRNHPVVFAANCGQGRAVQFTVNVRLWRNAVYGHARGLDDLVWRSIVWAARKPFAMLMTPPYITLSLDDCSGRHDLGYVDIAHKYGITMMPSLMLSNIGEHLYSRIADDMRSGRAVYNTHAMSYYDLFIYDFGKAEKSDAAIKANFEFEDQWWSRIGVTQGPVNRFHWGEYGQKALPYLKQRGRTVFVPALQIGLHKADQCMADGYAPYNLQNCYYDFLPNDNDFFTFASFPPRGSEDFLTGCTALLAESPRNDVAKAVASGITKLTMPLRCGFAAELVSHEQKFEVLSLPEWDAICSGIVSGLTDLNPIYTTHETIACFYQAKRQSALARVNRTGDTLRCELSGRSDVALPVSVFDADDTLARRYVTAEPFEGQAVLD